jgi:hypothetical protein
MTREQLFDILDPQHHATVQRWLDRGDGVAVYRNEAHELPRHGDRQFVSFGSPEAQIEMAEPPTRMPDIGAVINWAYQLEATVR